MAARCATTPTAASATRYDEQAVHVSAGTATRQWRRAGSCCLRARCPPRTCAASRSNRAGRWSTSAAWRWPDAQSHRHPVFIALLARLYLEVRRRGFEVACGIMSARARSCCACSGLQVEVLGDDARTGASRARRCGSPSAANADDDCRDALASTCESTPVSRARARGGVGAAEAERVRQPGARRRCSRLVAHDVDRSAGSTCRRPATGGTSPLGSDTASGWPPRRRSRRSGARSSLSRRSPAARPAPKSAASAAASGKVAVHRARAVRVHVAQVGRVRRRRRPAPAACSAARPRRRRSARPGGTRRRSTRGPAPAEDRPARRRASRGALEHHETGALAHHEAVAVARRRDATPASGASTLRLMTSSRRNPHSAL